MTKSPNEGGYVPLETFAAQAQAQSDHEVPQPSFGVSVTQKMTAVTEEAQHTIHLDVNEHVVGYTANSDDEGSLQIDLATLSAFGSLNEDESVLVLPIAALNGGDKRGYPDGNPKTAMGAKKPDITVVPPIGILHMSTAMMNGAEKYGPFNWREQAISSRPYIAAALRHLLAYLDGEIYSADTTEAGRPVHHLGHVMACCGILLDAESIGMLNDNRPAVPGKTGAAIEIYNEHKRLA